MDEGLKSILEEVGKGPLRSSVITASALIDALLQKVLTRFLVDVPKLDELFKHNGALGSFSSKISMSFALGLISKELHDDINQFRKIRNICAHEFSIDEKLMNDIKSQVCNFQFLKHVELDAENKDVQYYLRLEFALILFCLIKRLENVQKLTEYEFEVRDNFPTFTEEENKYITDFTNKMKAK